MSREIDRAIEESGQPLNYIEYEAGGFKHQTFYIKGGLPKEVYNELIAKLTTPSKQQIDKYKKIGTEFDFFDDNPPVADRMAYEASGTIEIHYHLDDGTVYTIDTRNNLISIKISDSGFVTTHLARLTYEPRTGFLLYVTLGQDEDLDIDAILDEEFEMEKEYIITNPQALQSALDAAIELGITTPDEVNRIQNLITTERVFLLNDILDIVLKEYEAERFLGEDLSSEAQEVGAERADKYRVGQNHMATLTINLTGGGLTLEFYQDYNSYLGDPRDEMVSKPDKIENIDLTGGEYNYFGDKYTVYLNPNKTISFGVERENGNKKTLTFPIEIPKDQHRKLKDLNSFDWLNLKWPHKINLSKNFSS